MTAFVNISQKPPEGLESMEGDDTSWVLANTFLILTMQTGFGLLECGSVTSKSSTNIMVKNVVDVSVGGFAFWLFGYAFSFGKPSNAFMGYGMFLPRTDDEAVMGSFYTHYVFQFSVASLATTIVSGAVAERMKLSAYIAFSFFNVVVYSIPASWVRNVGVGFLNTLGFFDFAGSTIVHFNGGMSALVACIMIGARNERYEKPENFQMSSPVTALVGMFMLCWAWLAFNCGSTYGVSGNLWKLAAKVAATTLHGGIGGGLVGLLLSRLVKKTKYDVCWLINSMLGGLVGVTAACSVIDPLYALLLGMFCGAAVIAGKATLDRFRIDDPVGAIPVHCLGGLLGTLAVGLIGRNDAADQLSGLNGLVHSGDFRLLGIQSLGVLCVGAWAAGATFAILTLIDKSIGLRRSPEEERMGADFVEHGFRMEHHVQATHLTTWNDQRSRFELEATIWQVLADMRKDSSRTLARPNGIATVIQIEQAELGSPKEPKTRSQWLDRAKRFLNRVLQRVKPPPTIGVLKRHAADNFRVLQALGNQFCTSDAYALRRGSENATVFGPPIYSPEECRRSFRRSRTREFRSRSNSAAASLISRSDMINF